MFVQLTLNNQLNNKFTLSGKQIINLITDMLKEERQTQYEEILDLIVTEFDKSEYNVDMAQWEGMIKNDKIYNSIKKEILFEVKDKLKKFKL